jgi:hypothetical protein
LPVPIKREVSVKPATSTSERIKATLGPLELRLAEAGEIEDAHALALRLIGPGIVSLEQLKTIQAWTRLSVFALREERELTGVFAFLLLNERGLCALLAEFFDGRSPDLEHLCRSGQGARAYYGWGFAGATRTARRAVVGGAADLRAALPHLPFYCHAATEAGRRAITEKLGYGDIPGSTSGLLGAPALASEVRRAA